MLNHKTMILSNSAISGSEKLNFFQKTGSKRIIE